MGIMNDVYHLFIDYLDNKDLMKEANIKLDKKVLKILEKNQYIIDAKIELAAIKAYTLFKSGVRNSWFNPTSDELEDVQKLISYIVLKSCSGLNGKNKDAMCSTGCITVNSNLTEKDTNLSLDIEFNLESIYLE